MSKGEAVEVEKKGEINPRAKEKRERNSPPTKVVVRKLPPTMTEETFIEQVSPLPEHDYLYFVKGDLSLGQFAFSRAYINFINQEDLFIFTEKFDGYVFVDNKGAEFCALVEFAPFQKVPKRASRKRDSKCGSIESDPEFLRFLESKTKEDEGPPSSTQEVLEEIEAKEREMRANHGMLKNTTPLLDFLRQRKEEKIRVREEKKEERRRREADRRKLRDEERRRPNKDFKDKLKAENKPPKQLLTHKDKASDAELTKKLKEALKINSTPDKQQDQKKEASSKEKDTHIKRDKDHRRDKEHHSDKVRDKDHSDKERAREHHSDKVRDKDHSDKERAREHHSDKVRDKDHSDKERAREQHSDKMRDKEREYRNEREKERAKRREEEKARKQARKPEGNKNDTQKCGESVPVKETKSYQSFREERQKQQEARAARKLAQKARADEEKPEEAEESTSKPERIRNKDRPSIELYRPGMLKKRVTSVGGRQDSASTSASSSPTPPTAMTFSRSAT